MTDPDIHFMHITAATLKQVCDLSETLSPAHRRMVADNVRSIAQAHFSPSAWMRAIYADDTPIGFIMTHTGSDYEDGIDCPGVLLCRFMIAESYQGKGYGKRALEKLIQQLKAMGIPQLYGPAGRCFECRVFQLNINVSAIPDSPTTLILIVCGRLNMNRITRNSFLILRSSLQRQQLIVSPCRRV